MFDLLTLLQSTFVHLTPSKLTPLHTQLLGIPASQHRHSLSFKITGDQLTSPQVRSLAEEVMGGFFETFPRLTFTGCDLTNADPQIVNKLIEGARELIFESCKVQLRLEAWTPQFDRCETLTLTRSKLVACDYDKKASNMFPSLRNLRIDSCSVVKAPNILPLVDFETLDTLWVACGDKESGR